MRQYFLLFLTVASLYAQTSGTTLPVNCVVGAIFVKTNAPAGQNTYVALATAAPCTTWTLQGGAGAAAVGPVNAVQASNGSGALVDSGCTATGGQTTCPSGFVSTSASPTLITMNCGTAPGTPATGKAADYCDSANKGFSVKTDAGIVQRTVQPTDCTSVGLVQKINADGTVGCAAAGGGGGGATAGTVYTQSFTSQTSVALAHGMALSPATAFTAQCFDSTGNLITPANLIATSASTVTATFGSAQTGSCTINGGGGAHYYAATMASATTWTIAGTTHLLATCDINVMAWDAATGVRRMIIPAGVSCDDTAGAYTVVVTFGAAQAGRVVLISAK